MIGSIHLAIDAMGAKCGGSATGLVNILDAALNDPRISKITLFCTPSERRVFEIPSSVKLIESPKPWVDKNYVLRILWHEWLLGYECRKIRADVLLVSANFGQARSDVPHVTYIRQSLPFSKEALNSLSMKDRFINRTRRMTMMRSCRNAAKIICQSSVMKGSVTDAFGLDPKRVISIYSSPKRMDLLNNPKLFSETNGKPGNESRLLYVGDTYPYKKLDTIVYGTELIRKQFSTAKLSLTLPIDHHYASLPGVECIGYLNDAQLAVAYMSAEVLVLSSLVESGPQPPIEAMSFGTPVLIADRPYAHDICGSAALFFDPMSPEDLAEKAIKLLTDQTLRKTLIERGYALIEKRRDEKPYQKIVDILVDVAMEATRKPKIPYN